MSIVAVSLIPCPSLVTLGIVHCDNLAMLPDLPPSLKNLAIIDCGELCSVSGELGELEELHIFGCNKLQSVYSLGDALSLETLFLSRCQCLASLEHQLCIKTTPFLQRDVTSPDKFPTMYRAGPDPIRGTHME
jgi:hypothetical protein